MPSVTIEYHDDAERLVIEQAAAYISQVRRVADDAPAGSVLAVAERVALAEGRDVLRAALASALQRRADSADASQKKPAPAPRAGVNAGC